MMKKSIRLLSTLTCCLMFVTCLSSSFAYADVGSEDTMVMYDQNGENALCVKKDVQINMPSITPRSLMTNGLIDVTADVELRFLEQPQGRAIQTETSTGWDGSYAIQFTVQLTLDRQYNLGNRSGDFYDIVSIGGNVTSISDPYMIVTGIEFAGGAGFIAYDANGNTIGGSSELFSSPVYVLWGNGVNQPQRYICPNGVRYYDMKVMGHYIGADTRITIKRGQSSYTSGSIAKVGVGAYTTFGFFGGR